MSHLVTREDDMLGVQVLIGIVILFLETNDYKPAAVVIGNAAKLAYRLGLHQADSPMHGSPREAEQRARVFWITYFFDRVSPGFLLCVVMRSNNEDCGNRG